MMNSKEFRYFLIKPENNIHKNDHKDDIDRVVEHLVRLEQKLDSLIAKK